MKARYIIFGLALIAELALGQSTPNAAFEFRYKCGSTDMVLQNSPPSGYDWFYQIAADGTSTTLGMSSSKTITTTTRLFLRTRSRTTLAWSQNSQDLGTIPVYSVVPPAPSVGHDSYTFVGPVTISVDPVPGAVTYVWYNKYGDLIAGQTGNAYTFPLLTNTSVFFVTSKNGCGESARKTVTATIEQVPIIEGDLALIFDDPVVLSVQGDYASYAWSRNSLPITGSSASLTVREPGTYRVTITKSGISGSASSQPVTVAIGASQNQNYVREYVVLKKGVTNEQAAALLPVAGVHQITYYADGLGRGVQTVIARQSPSEKDIVTPQIYDAFGRETKEYLPYVSDSKTGEYQTRATGPTYLSSDQLKFYTSNQPEVARSTNPYAQKVFEETPLNRVSTQGAPGEPWQPGNPETDHVTRNDYAFNGEGEVVLFKYDGVQQRMYRSGFYEKNKLHKTTVTDEQKHVVMEFTNKSNQVVMRKVQVSEANGPELTNWAFTYYVYDDWGNLVVVLPPEAVNALLKLPAE